MIAFKEFAAGCGRAIARVRAVWIGSSRVAFNQRQLARLHFPIFVQCCGDPVREKGRFARRVRRWRDVVAQPLPKLAPIDTTGQRHRNTILQLSVGFGAGVQKFFLCRQPASLVRRVSRLPRLLVRTPDGAVVEGEKFGGRVAPKPRTNECTHVGVEWLG